MEALDKSEMRHKNDSQTRNMGMEFRKDFRSRSEKLEINIFIFFFLLFLVYFCAPLILQGI